MILELHRQGVSVSAIARQVGLDRKTVHKYIERGLEPPMYGPRVPRASKIAPFTRYLRERLAAFPQLSGRRLHRELRELGYTGGYSILTDFLRDIRPTAPAPFEVRFETPPGRQAQVDFAHFRTLFTDEPGTERILWLFSLVLGHSRMLWARFVLHQDLPALLRCQAAAFEALGGVPEHILYDRMRTGFSREDPEAGHIIYNRTLLDAPQWRTAWDALWRSCLTTAAGFLRRGWQTPRREWCRSMRGEAAAAPIDRIRSHLVGLRMPRALETLDHVMQQLERGQLGAIEAVEALLAEEITVRESRRVKAALQMARLATIKTLSGFDFSFQPSLDRNRILALAQLDFIDRHEVVHFIGQSGTGKSHLAAALGVEAVRAGRSVYFSPLADIIDSLAKADREGRLRERIRFLYRSVSSTLKKC